MSDEKRVADLRDAIEKLGTAGYQLPVVEFKNETPSGWNAIIVAMGAAFFYKDPNNEKPIGDEQQQRPGPLHSGAASYVQGTRTECCARVVAAMTVQMNGQTQTLQARGEVPAGRCFLRMAFTLRPAQSINAADRGANALPLELILE